MYLFDGDCCEDQLDRDGDGQADCTIPPDHEPNTCPDDGSQCATCDSAADCGGEADLCVVRSDGYGFCGRACTTSSDCGSGYACTAILARRVINGITIQQFNEADGGQEVFHLHVHVLPRRAGVALRAPGQMGDMDDIQAIAEKIRAAI